MENLNAQELSSQLTDGKAERADLAGDSGSDDSCRKPPCVQLAAEYEEARNRFQQTVQKLNIKLEKAEKSACAEHDRAGELANAKQEMKTIIENFESEVKDAKDKLRFEENRRCQSAHQRSQ